MWWADGGSGDYVIQVWLKGVVDRAPYFYYWSNGGANYRAVFSYTACSGGSSGSKKKAGIVAVAVIVPVVVVAAVAIAVGAFIVWRRRNPRFVGEKVVSRAPTETSFARSDSKLEKQTTSVLMGFR